MGSTPSTRKFAPPESLPPPFFSAAEHVCFPFFSCVFPVGNAHTEDASCRLHVGTAHVRDGPRPGGPIASRVMRHELMGNYPKVCSPPSSRQPIGGANFRVDGVGKSENTPPPGIHLPRNLVCNSLHTEFSYPLTLQACLQCRCDTSWQNAVLMLLSNAVCLCGSVCLLRYQFSGGGLDFRFS